MTNKGSSPLVVLLMDDVDAAQSISLVFRKMGVIPSFFRELKTFWYSIIKDRPKLAIIDVKKLNEGHYFVKDHPLISSQMIPIAFYYGRDGRPLLTSTYEFFHYGLIGEDDPYDLVMKVIFERVIRSEKMREEVYSLEERLKNTKARYEQLQGNQRLEEKSLQTFEGLLLKISKSFNDLFTVEKYFDFIADQFTAYSEIIEFSVVSLDKGKSKLVSPSIYSLKYRPIPDLKLGQTLEHGIEFFAQNMVLEVELEILGGEIIPIHLYGKERNPDYMLFFRVSDSAKESCSWKVLESTLNAVYSRSLTLQKSSGPISDGVKNSVYPWTVLGKMENRAKGQSFFQIDSSALVDFIRNEKTNKFHWDAFYKDFMNHYSMDIDTDVEFFPVSIEQLVLKFETQQKNKIKESIEIFITQFQYQCYFEGVFPIETLDQIRAKVWEMENYLNAPLNIL